MISPIQLWFSTRNEAIQSNMSIQKAVLTYSLLGRRRWYRPISVVRVQQDTQAHFVHGFCCRLHQENRSKVA